MGERDCNIKKWLIRSEFNNGKIPLFVKRINNEYTKVDYNDEDYIFITFTRKKDLIEYKKKKKMWLYNKNRKKYHPKQKVIIYRPNMEYTLAINKYGIENVNYNDYKHRKPTYINCPELKEEYLRNTKALMEGTFRCKKISL